MVETERSLRKQIDLERKQLKIEQAKTDLFKERRKIREERASLKRERSSGFGKQFATGAGILGRGTLRAAQGIATFSQRVSASETARNKQRTKVATTQRKRVKKISTQRRKKVKKFRERGEQIQEKQVRSDFGLSPEERGERGSSSFIPTFTDIP